MVRKYLRKMWKCTTWVRCPSISLSHPALSHTLLNVWMAIFSFSQMSPASLKTYLSAGAGTAFPLGALGAGSQSQSILLIASLASSVMNTTLCLPFLAFSALIVAVAGCASRFRSDTLSFRASASLIPDERSSRTRASIFLLGLPIVRTLRTVSMERGSSSIFSILGCSTCSLNRCASILTSRKRRNFFAAWTYPVRVLGLIPWRSSHPTNPSRTP